MDFIGLTMVKNEEDIIEQFVRHNLAYFKKIYVFDHSSSDNTVKILNQLCAEGLPIVQVFDHSKSFSIGYAQTEIMTSILRLAIQDNGAAVYFPIDADEFMYPNVSADELKRQIDILAPNTALNIPWLAMAFPDNADERLFSDAPKSFELLERWRDNPPHDNPRDKMAIKVTNPEIGNQLTLMQGNHNVLSNGAWVQKDYSCDSIRYIHVPVRSPEQAFRKFVCGWLSNVQKFGRNSGFGIHWKNAFDLICEDDGHVSTHLAYLLNCIYTDPAEIDKDFEMVDAKSIFKYELAYGDMRKKGLGVILRNVESDFETLFTKLPQKT